jgi:hypothetical protein
MASAWAEAARLVMSSMRPSPAGGAMLIEGLDYQGCWLESTGSISAETLSRFCPGLAQETFLGFARLASADGLIPYKITQAGPAYRQLQIVSPLARSVLHHAGLHGLLEDGDFVREMYNAMSANDAWIARHRDTRGSGCVEAFCAFDTGHDLSPRFWQLPDTCLDEDPARCDPDFPRLPFLAPDLTANVHAQRLALAVIARRMGRTSEALSWEAKAAASLEALMRECYDPNDGCFYDRDAFGQLVRVQGDALLRVFCCGSADAAAFERALSAYLLNSRKFLAKYPPSSIALDDPRFDPASDRNSWAGPTNLLSLLRAPAAFELYGRYAEFLFYARPLLEALRGRPRFSQCLDPWSGREGFGRDYTPSALCLLDYVERCCGIMPLPDGSLRLSSARWRGLAKSAYARLAGRRRLVLHRDAEESALTCDGREVLRFPSGAIVFIDTELRPLRLVCTAPGGIEGALAWEDLEIPLRADPNQAFAFEGGKARVLCPGGIVQPT